MWYYPTTQECQFIKLKLKSRVSNPTLFLLIIILKTKKAEFSVERRKTMVKKTEKNNFSIYSKKILNHLNSDRFAEQLLEFFESIRIKDVFETFQDFYINDYYSSECISDYLKRSKVINILEYYRENFPKEYKYSDMREDSEAKDFSRKFEKMVETADLERNDNYSRICRFLEKFEKTQIGLDVETLELKLVKNSTEIPTLCDPDSDTHSKLDDTTQTIRLLNLINISNMNNLNYSSVEDKSHFNLLRYIAGIIKGEEFADELAKEIKENVAKKIASLSISSRDLSHVNLKEFPAVFYEDEDLVKFILKLGDFYKKVVDIYNNDQNNKKMKSAMVNCFDVTKLDRDIFHKLLESFPCREKDSLIQIKGYSGLSAEEQKNVLFSTFDIADEFKSYGFKDVPVNVLKDHLNNDEMFELIKNKTKTDLLNILHGKEDELRGLVNVKNNKKQYNVILKSTYPLYDFDFKLNENQISELRTELVPILEQLQDVLCYENDFFAEDFNGFPDTKEKLFKYITKNKNYLLINLFEAIDWYPNEYILSAKFNGINEYSKIKSRSHFVNRLSEKFGFKLKVCLYSEYEIQESSNGGFLDKINKNKNLKLLQKDLGDNFQLICKNLSNNFESECEKIIKGSKLNRKTLLFNFSKEK